MSSRAHKQNIVDAIAVELRAGEDIPDDLDEQLRGAIKRQPRRPRASCRGRLRQCGSFCIAHCPTLVHHRPPKS